MSSLTLSRWFWPPRFAMVKVVCLLGACFCFPLSSVHAQTQAEMNAQARKDFERVDAELNKIYQSLLAKLADTEAKNKLRESQRAWIVTRDAEAASAADQVRCGSAAPVLRWTSMTETTEQRIKQLKPIFQMTATHLTKRSSQPAPRLARYPRESGTSHRTEDMPCPSCTMGS